MARGQRMKWNINQRENHIWYDDEIWLWILLRWRFVFSYEITTVYDYYDPADIHLIVLWSQSLIPATVFRFSKFPMNLEKNLSTWSSVYRFHHICLAHNKIDQVPLLSGRNFQVNSNSFFYSKENQPQRSPTRDRVVLTFGGFRLSVNLLAFAELGNHERYEGDRVSTNETSQA
jgi:hypothetical protein